MFNRIFKKLKPSKELAENIYSFEKNDTSPAKAAPTHKSINSVKHTHSISPSQLNSTAFIHDFPEQVLQSLYYTYLFGDAADHNLFDELSPLVKQKMEALLQSPKSILKTMPVLPTSVTELMTQICNQDFNTDTVLKLIKQEPIVAAKVLKLANSSYYNKGQKPQTELKSAFLLLGVDGLSEGVINSFIKHLVPQGDVYFKFYGKRLWASSVMTANYAKQLLQKSSDFQLAPQAHLLGLVNNIGDIILYQLMIEAFKSIHPDNQPSSELFKELLKDNSKRLTYTLARQWQFPAILTQSLAIQTQLENSQISFSNLTKQPLACYLYEAKLLTKLRLSQSNNLVNNEELTSILNHLTLSKEAKALAGEILNLY